MNQSSKLPIPYKMHRGMKCINQKACNEFWDGSKTFVRGDIHPTFSGLVFRNKLNDKPYWVTPEKLKIEVDNHRERNRQWIIENPKIRSECSKRYRLANLSKRASFEAQRRAKKLGADISFEGIDQYTDWDKKITEGLFAQAKRLSEILGTPFEVDHVQPLSLGGSNKAYNLQVTPQKWNREKSNNSFAIWGAPFGRSDMHLFDCEILPTN